MTLTQLDENADGTVSVKLDMTPEEHKQLLESAIIRAMHLTIEEQKKTEEMYK